MKVKVDLIHKTHGSVTTEVELPDMELVLAYEDIVHQARKNVASRFVDYESFGSDSAYAERLDEVGDEFVPEDIRIITDKPSLRYRVYGHYSTDDGGTWCDWVFGSTPDEAEFQAKWIMAVNESSNPGETADFAATMEDIEIYDCDLEPITKDEAVDLLNQLVGEWPQFDGDEDVNGGDMVEWFGEYRARVKEALAGKQLAKVSVKQAA